MTTWTSVFFARYENWSLANAAAAKLTELSSAMKAAGTEAYTSPHVSSVFAKWAAEEIGFEWPADDPWYWSADDEGGAGGLVAASFGSTLAVRLIDGAMLGSKAWARFCEATGAEIWGAGHQPFEVEISFAVKFEATARHLAETGKFPDEDWARPHFVAKADEQAAAAAAAALPLPLPLPPDASIAITLSVFTGGPEPFEVKIGYTDQQSGGAVLDALITHSHRIGVTLTNGKALPPGPCAPPFRRVVLDRSRAVVMGMTHAGAATVVVGSFAKKPDANRCAKSLQALFDEKAKATTTTTTTTTTTKSSTKKPQFPHVVVAAKHVLVLTDPDANDDDDNNNNNHVIVAHLKEQGAKDPSIIAPPSYPHFSATAKAPFTPQNQLPIRYLERFAGHASLSAAEKDANAREALFEANFVIEPQHIPWAHSIGAATLTLHSDDGNPPKHYLLYRVGRIIANFTPAKLTAFSIEPPPSGPIIAPWSFAM
jgi:hypothetical protein